MTCLWVWACKIVFKCPPPRPFSAPCADLAPCPPRFFYHLPTPLQASARFSAVSAGCLGKLLLFFYRTLPQRKGGYGITKNGANTRKSKPGLYGITHVPKHFVKPEMESNKWGNRLQAQSCSIELMSCPGQKSQEPPASL